MPASSPPETSARRSGAETSAVADRGGREPGATSTAGRPVRFFARNRRDGARLLSSALVIMVVGLTGWQHQAGRIVAVAAGLVSLYWWLQYRRLTQ